MRVAVYARYSTDRQNERSIEDQVRLCTQRLAQLTPDAGPPQVFADAGLSGASMVTRPGLQQLLAAVRRGDVALVIAESLSRLSRNQADSATIFQLCEFSGVRLVTVEDGDVEEMAIGFKGTMNALYLKSLGAATSRGLQGLVARGLMAGGLSYGYRVIERGTWGIVEAEAAIVRRIFDEYAAGLSPQAIAQRLNAEGVPGPTGGAWSPSTVHGHQGRGTGILNNDTYRGTYCWPKSKFLKDPRTGKRVSRSVPDAQRGTYPRPHLRIVSDDVWAAVKQRQAAMRHVWTGGLGRTRRPVFLFSGLTKCGVCGGGFVVQTRHELRCHARSKRGTCTNGRMLTRQEVEARVLRALKEKFLTDPIAFAEFSRAFVDERNRVIGEQAAARRAAPRELAAINARSKAILELLLQGFSDEAWKVELKGIEARRTVLEAEIAALPAEPVPPALHPAMATIYRQKVEQLAAALDHADDTLRTQARETLRGLITGIVIPAEGLLAVRGDLGRMLEVSAAGECAGTAPGGVDGYGCGGGI